MQDCPWQQGWLWHEIFPRLHATMPFLGTACSNFVGILERSCLRKQDTATYHNKLHGMACCGAEPPPVSKGVAVTLLELVKKLPSIKHIYSIRQAVIRSMAQGPKVCTREDRDSHLSRRLALSGLPLTQCEMCFCASRGVVKLSSVEGISLPMSPEVNRSGSIIPFDF
jgi:hypothetical protein